MDLTTEQLQQVRDMAALLITPSLIAKAIGIDPIAFKVLCEDPEEELHKAYYEAFIQAKMKLHTSIINSATSGAYAQLEMKKLITESENYLQHV